MGKRTALLSIARVLSYVPQAGAGHAVPPILRGGISSGGGDVHDLVEWARAACIRSAFPTNDPRTTKAILWFQGEAAVFPVQCTSLFQKIVPSYPPQTRARRPPLKDFRRPKICSPGNVPLNQRNDPSASFARRKRQSIFSRSTGPSLKPGIPPPFAGMTKS